MKLKKDRLSKIQGEEFDLQREQTVLVVLEKLVADESDIVGEYFH